MRTATIGALVFLAAAVPAYGQRGRSEVAEGNRHYAEGDYPAARESYLEALREAPESPLIRFNEGNALYRSDSFDEALNSYRSAVAADDTTLQARAWYNMGNALFRQDQFQESVEAYKETLRLDPTDDDARHNLELALNRLQQQEQQQQDQDQDQQGDQGDQEQQQQDQQQGDQQQGEQQQPDEQDGQEQQQQEPEDQQGQQQPQDQDGLEQDQAQPQEAPEGQMTREEAERLLQAIDENPGEVRRQQRRARGRVTVARDW